MKLLFITMDLPDLNSNSGSFYGDFIKQLAKVGHNVYVLCQAHDKSSAGKRIEGEINVVRVRVPFLKRNTNLFVKGVGSLLMNPCYISAYKKHLVNEEFDYVLMHTPPPTMVDIVKKIKLWSSAKLYLILRDIQPECANRKVSAEILKRTDVYNECKKPFGINIFARVLLYRKSQTLYKISDRIGCMSPGNIEFIKSIAPYLKDDVLKILPNWYKEPQHFETNKEEILAKYNLSGRFVALYGGNIGPQQAVWNIATLAKHYINNKDIVFLVVGRGTKLNVLKAMANQDKLTNIIFIDYLSSTEYNSLLRVVDLGIISLDEKYKVPTCPSKIIGYMAMQKPVLAMINSGSDYGEYYIDRPGCGLYSVGLDTEKMRENMQWMMDNPQGRKTMGENGYRYYLQHFSVEKVCDELCKQLTNE